MPSNDKLFAYNLGQIVPLNEATLHISDLSVQRGYGVFDFVKVQQGYPLFLDDYLDRFYQSAELMHLAVPLSREEIKQVISKLTDLNKLPVAGMKMILTGGYSEDGFTPMNPNLLITQLPLTLPSADKVAKGIPIMTHDYVREVPEVKTINYSMGIRLLQEQKASGAEEVLYAKNAIVSEFPRCNFFIVTHDGTVVTPASNILKGITRKNVLSLAGRRYKTEVRDIRLEEVLQAREAFLTSTTKRILPIVQIDEAMIGTGKPGEVSMQLLQDLISLEVEQVAAAKGW
ncbi:aminotransferase class IV [Pontibacter lucknowensis]|uniref:branched-chain-amino-acid transaminase n=1 Tax=Pontibacter lucknowensis TaxID=1077936 RepID=A0A1N6XEM9_9BACT|nr:aminotransferase class IV [Pontibacter lucknowensis]SIR00717.1 branched-chain amino acid aminotransferase [Pontibacter lucknowensis]